jgi:hypothetical protein
VSLKREKQGRGNGRGEGKERRKWGEELKERE